MRLARKKCVLFEDLNEKLALSAGAYPTRFSNVTLVDIVLTKFAIKSRLAGLDRTLATVVISCGSLIYTFGTVLTVVFDAVISLLAAMTLKKNQSN